MPRLSGRPFYALRYNDEMRTDIRENAARYYDLSPENRGAGMQGEPYGEGPELIIEFAASA